MKTRFYEVLVISIGLVWLTSACVKETAKDDFPLAGTKISFTVATSYGNTNGTRTVYDGTRTVYSGITSGGAETINWTNNDKIKIHYLNGASSSSTTPVGDGVYSITNIKSTNKNQADISHDSGTGTGSDLEWGSGSSHKFYGVYPSSAGLNSAGKVTSSIPATTQSFTYNSTQGKYLPTDMSYALMVSYADNAQISNNTVDLPFTPAVTAFEFKLKLPSGKTSLGIKEIELKSENEYISGSFYLNITGYDSTNDVVTWGSVNPNGNNGKVITATIPTGNSNPNLSDDDFLDFTVFAIPVDITALTLKIKYSNDKVQAIPLKKNGSWVQFDAGKKHVISNSSVPDEKGWQFTVETIDDVEYYGHGSQTASFSVKSYKTSSVPGDTGVSAAPWKLQYSTYNGNSWTTWADVNSSTGSTGTDFTVSAGRTGNGVSSTSSSETCTVNLSALADQSSNKETVAARDAIHNELKNRTPPAANSTRADAVDLSAYDIYGNAHNTTTANCYVISAPGWYKLPCVYGNAISGGTVNPASYIPYLYAVEANGSQTTYDKYNDNSTVPEFRYLGQFRNVLNTNINPASQGWIVSDLTGAVTDFSASILWQNTMSNSSSASIVSDVQYSSNYISFKVDPETIEPGNAIIALTGTWNNTSVVLWSWHIWVTEKALSSVQVGSRSFMKNTLGFIDSPDAQAAKFKTRTIKFRVLQTETGGTSEEFSIEQIGDLVSVSENVGSNPYYQWGRKDPMRPGVRANSTNSDATTNSNVSFGFQTVTGKANSSYWNSTLKDNTQHNTTVYGTTVEPHWILHSTLTGTPVNFAHGIMNPSFYVVNDVTCSWIEGYYNAWAYTVLGDPAPVTGHYFWGTTRNAQWGNSASGNLHSSIPYNLWNNGVYKTISIYTNKYKTIYDPCPPGFCVPHLGAFDGFNDSETTTNVGRYFPTKANGVFLPFTGFRQYTASGSSYTMPLTEYAAGCRLWTDCPEDLNWDSTTMMFTQYEYANSFQCGRSSLNIPTDAFDGGTTDLLRCNALSILPMVDPKY